MDVFIRYANRDDYASLREDASYEEIMGLKANDLSKGRTPPFGNKSLEETKAIYNIPPPPFHLSSLLAKVLDPTNTPNLETLAWNMPCQISQLVERDLYLNGVGPGLRTLSNIKHLKLGDYVEYMIGLAPNLESLAIGEYDPELSCLWFFRPDGPPPETRILWAIQDAVAQSGTLKDTLGQFKDRAWRPDTKNFFGAFSFSLILLSRPLFPAPSYQPIPTHPTISYSMSDYYQHRKKKKKKNYNPHIPHVTNTMSTNASQNRSRCLRVPIEILTHLPNLKSLSHGGSIHPNYPPKWPSYLPPCCNLEEPILPSSPITHTLRAYLRNITSHVPQLTSLGLPQSSHLSLTIKPGSKYHPAMDPRCQNSYQKGDVPTRNPDTGSRKLSSYEQRKVQQARIIDLATRIVLEEIPTLREFTFDGVRSPVFSANVTSGRKESGGEDDGTHRG